MWKWLSGLRFKKTKEVSVKKLLIWLVVGFLFLLPLRTESAKVITWLAEIVEIADSLAVASADTVYTDPFLVEAHEYFTLHVLGISADTPHVRILRTYNFSDYNPPDSTTWAEIELDGSEDELIADFSKKVWCVDYENPKYDIWVRYKLIGLTSPANPADTKISMVIVKQRKEVGIPWRPQ